jgi:SAM-dependent methyltransferase
VSEPLKPTLDQMTRTTLEHYEASAEGFWEGTQDHDVSQNIEALLAELDGPGPKRILDLGCGPGRDLIAFRDLGHHPVGLDGTLAFVEMARRQSRVDVLHQNFLTLDLPQAHFDGVFANATLFHVPTSELARVLGELRRCLRPGGVLFASNPRGDNHEGWNGQRYCVYHDLAQWRRFVMGAGFEEVRHYYRPAGLPREQQPWLATLWRNPTES